MIEIISMIYPVISIVYIIRVYKIDFLSPSLFFLLTQLAMFIGISRSIDRNIYSDNVLIILYLLALIMFILGTEFGGKLFKTKRKLEIINVLTKRQKYLIILIIIVSILLCIYFFVSAGGNVFLSALSKLITEKRFSNLTENRFKFNNIKGVGFIYQFRAILLPLLTIFLALFSVRKLKIFGFILIPFSLIFILGTGQRGGFVLIVLILTYILFLLYNITKKRKNLIIFFGLALTAILIFALMTFANGRVTINYNIFSAILKRFTSDNQISGIVAFRYIFEQEIQWGRDWWYSLMGVLPGKNSYEHLSNIIYKVMYGTNRGTAPPDIWGSVYFNFSYIGNILVPFIIGFAYKYLNYRFYKLPITSLRFVIYSALFVISGVWIADTPTYFFNQGFVTLVILGSLLRIDKQAREIYFLKKNQ